MRLAFYFSLSFYSMNDCKLNGHCVVPSIQFSMTNRNTVNICNVNCTKFLGKTIDVYFLAICKLASDNMKQKVVLYLQHIDDFSIRGKYKLKVWILKNFVTSVLHFHTAVERLSLTSI